MRGQDLSIILVLVVGTIWNIMHPPMASKSRCLLSIPDGPNISKPVIPTLANKKALVTTNIGTMKHVLEARGFEVLDDVSDVTKHKPSFFWTTQAHLDEIYDVENIDTYGPHMTKHSSATSKFSDRLWLQDVVINHIAGSTCKYAEENFLPKVFDLNDARACGEFFTTVIESSDSSPLLRTNFPNNAVGLLRYLNERDIDRMRDWYEYDANANRCLRKNRAGLIAQLPVHNPLIIDNNVIEFRHFLLIASYHPLVVYAKRGYLKKVMYDTSDVEENPLRDVIDEEAPLARSPSARGEYLNEADFIDEMRNLGALRPNTLYRNIKRTFKELCALTLYSALREIVRHDDPSGWQKHLKHSFEMIAFDLVLDVNLNAHIVDVNVDPDLHIETELDRDIKTTLLEEALDIVFEVDIRKKFAEAHPASPNVKSTATDTFELVFDESVNPIFTVLDRRCLAPPS